MNRLIFIGIESSRAEATNGEIVKNQILLNKFREIYDEVYVIDLFNLKKRVVSVVFRLLLALLQYPRTRIVLSASTKVAYRFIKAFDLIKRKNVYYWVVGGAFSDALIKGEYPVKPYKNLKYIMVQGSGMVEQLHKVGLSQTRLVLNAKPISYLPQKKVNHKGGFVKFVFISRVSPGKGCDYIFEAVNRLNANNYKNKFTVTFYGKIENGYKNFLPSIAAAENIEYKGFLDLQEQKSYDVLASYDVMLFPSYWEGEGFAGIFIDAFIAGLPVICSDWNCNAEFINDEVGKVIPVHDVEALAEAMKQCIDGTIDVKTLSENCQKRAIEYDINNVFSERHLKDLDLMD